MSRQPGDRHITGPTTSHDTAGDAQQSTSALQQAMALTRPPPAAPVEKIKKHRSKSVPYRRVNEAAAVVAASKPRQEISRCLKYLVFIMNFIVTLTGLAALVAGAYLYISFYTPVTEILDFVLNPGLALIWIGAVVTAVALMGAVGALRDHTCLLKAFSLTIFLCYIILVVAAFLTFILFYSQSSDGLSIEGLMMHAIRRYHLNANMREIMNNMQCCGASSLGYKDWSQNEQYNCSVSNPAVERCGVPYSCCRQPTSLPGGGVGGDRGDSVDVEHANQIQHMPALTCWQSAQNRSLTTTPLQIYTDGCTQFVHRAFEAQAVTLGAVIGAFVVPVCVAVTLANILAKQIDRQQYLLNKQATRQERRKRRERHRFRDPFAQPYTPTGRQPACTAEMEQQQAAAQIVDETSASKPQRKVRRRAVSSTPHAYDKEAVQRKDEPEDARRAQQRNRGGGGATAKQRVDRVRATGAGDERLITEMERQRRAQQQQQRMVDKRRSLADNNLVSNREVSK